MTQQHRDAARLTLEGRTQTEIARILGVGQQTVSRWIQEPEVSAYLAALARAQEEETLRVTAHNARKSAERLCSLSNKLAWRLQLDDGEKDLPPGQPGQHALYMDRFLAVNREMRETQDALVARRVKLEAHASAMERHRFDMDAAKVILDADTAKDSEGEAGGTEILNLPDNGRQRRAD